MPPPVEISIPSTTISHPSGGGKPYTSYNITLRLPLRSFVVQKRYSEFEQLHTALVSQVGAAPPAPLPTKSWFRSTVNSAELTEKRRVQLEEYLQTVAGSPDRRWRDTPAWRAFLNLPAGSTAPSANSVHGAITTTAAAAGGGVVDAAEWIERHRRMNDTLRDARSCLARRDAAAAEAGLKKDGGLGKGEVRRREDMVKEAREDHRWLTQLSATLSGGAPTSGGTGGVASAADRAALVGKGKPRQGGRVLGAPLQETERTRELDNAGVLQLQRQTREEQDEDLEVLTRVIRRQKEMGLAIEEEVKQQTEMLDRMNEDVDRVGGKIKVAKDRTRKLGS
ncbi:v-SNARE [Pyricularia oryzae Y34]|uniref:V-SNARE n=1 Tax=Pyricularia oryzae (strain Y34) TaxID=1143189 RepID=A0AA97PI90_PYRO3|nr:v-SNARE [Pyricularia oryzae Y34]